MLFVCRVIALDAPPYSRDSTLLYATFSLLELTADDSYLGVTF